MSFVWNMVGDHREKLFLLKSYYFDFKSSKGWFSLQTRKFGNATDVPRGFGKIDI